MYDNYPNTSKAKLDDANRAMFPNRLSWNSGSTSGVYDRDGVSYKVSSLGGFSGAGVFDSQGRLIGIAYIC